MTTLQKIKRRRRVNPTHRWTEAETIQLLQMVSSEMKINPESFEKPTAQKFYEKLSSKYQLLLNIDWRVMKAKLRYLKGTYTSAVSWKNKANIEIMPNGDEISVEQQIKKACPNWNLLEAVFRQKNNFRQPVAYETTNDNSMEKMKIENEEIVCMKEIKNEHLDCEEDENTITSAPETFSPSHSENNFNQDRDKLSPRPYNNNQQNNPNTLALLLSIEERKIELETKKFELEKELAKNQVEIRKLELQQELEIKKIEIEQQERIEMKRNQLEIESRERIQMYELNLRGKRNDYI